MKLEKLGAQPPEYRSYGREKARRLVALTLGALALAGASPAGSSEQYSHPIKTGFVEDTTLNTDRSLASLAVQQVATSGATALKVTMPYSPGQAEVLNDEERLCNSAGLASEQNLDFTINVLPTSERKNGKMTANAIDTPNERWKFATTMGAWIHTLAKCVPDLKQYSLELGNEVNSARFWRPQEDAKGNPLAAKEYVKLLARSYRTIKNEASKMNVDVTVVGGALASNRQPLQFIQQMGQVKKELGLGSLMDQFSYHPYPKDSTEPPETKHPDGSVIGFGDYDQLVSSLDTANLGSKLPIVYSEFGWESQIPASQMADYQSGKSKDPVVSEQLQARYYSRALEIAACSERVIAAYIFHQKDDPNLDDWQSGIRYVNNQSKSSAVVVENAIKKSAAGGAVCQQ